MSFNQAQKAKIKMKTIDDSLKNFKILYSEINRLFEENFSVIKKLNSEMIHLASYNIDPNIIEAMDSSFTNLKSIKSNLIRNLQDFAGFDKNIENIQAMMNRGGESSVDEEFLDDMQSVVSKINQSLDGKLANLGEQTDDIKKQDEKFQESVDVSLEIFMKSIMEVMKNSSITTTEISHLIDEFYELSERLTSNTKFLEDIVGTVNESNELNKEIQTNIKNNLVKSINESVEKNKNNLTSELDTLKNSISSLTEELTNLNTKLGTLNEQYTVLQENNKEIEKAIENKFDKEFGKVASEISVSGSMIKKDVQGVVEKTLDSFKKDFTDDIIAKLETFMIVKLNEIQTQIIQQQKATVTTKGPQPVFSRDVQEIQTFINYLYEWPDNRREVMNKIEKYRDILIMDRSDEAPWRVTASSLFREAIGSVSRKGNILTKDDIRLIVDIMKKLEQKISE